MGNLVTFGIWNRYHSRGFTSKVIEILFIIKVSLCVFPDIPLSYHLVKYQKYIQLDYHLVLCTVGAHKIDTRFSELSVSDLLRSGIYWWNNLSRQVGKDIQEAGLSDRVGGWHDQILIFVFDNFHLYMYL